MSDRVYSDRVYNVLFLCTGNSARSILAEAILNKVGQGRFKGFSAGSRPKGQVHPHALELLENLNFPTDCARSKSWDEFAGSGRPGMDFIFSVCDAAAAETCPIWPGRPVSAHWGLADPAAVVGTPEEIRLAFFDAYRILNNRISAFVMLPLQNMEEPVLKQRLEAIGKDDLRFD